MTYRVHRFDLSMTRDADRLEQFLNRLEGEVVSMVPNAKWAFLWIHKVDFLLITEKVG